MIATIARKKGLGLALQSATKATITQNNEGVTQLTQPTGAVVSLTTYIDQVGAIAARLWLKGDRRGEAVFDSDLLLNDWRCPLGRRMVGSLHHQVEAITIEAKLGWEQPVLLAIIARRGAGQSEADAMLESCRLIVPLKQARLEATWLAVDV